MKWRWDQGRLDYFQLDEIKKSALALLECDNKALPRGADKDLIREALERRSSRPYLPDEYKVWRNYKRVFGCQLLAADVKGILKCTNLCRLISSNQITDDQYLHHVITNFRYPSPVFDGYQPSHASLYLGCSILKLLISEYVFFNRTELDLNVIIGTLKNTKTSGAEDIEFYKNVNRVVNYDSKILADELRQIREFVIFISQLSYLKWRNNKLILDVLNDQSAIEIFGTIIPRVLAPQIDPALEILQLGDVNSLPDIDVFRMLDVQDALEDEFIEGNRTRVTHLRVERSSKLRDFYFAQSGLNHGICDMCSVDTQKKYTWTDRVIELHHLLPLSSNLRVERNSTSLKDIVALCPTCHRAIHKFYTVWLRERSQKDFLSYEEARNVYNEAKSLIVGNRQE